MNSPKARHEYKHYINQTDFLQLRASLPCVAARDQNDIDGQGYRVRSLYFDSYTNKALREKIDGVNRREKFRIRLYNADTSFIRLEKKSKINGMCLKESAVISRRECGRLLAGEYDVLKEGEHHPLLLELYTKMHTQLLRPKNIVDYRREAFVFAPGNVRVTLDSDLRAGLDPLSFLRADFVPVPVPGPDILEVKYDEFLPEIIRGLVTLSSRQQSAFSKYAVTRII